jgi:tripartite motif-containing protein 71
MAIDSSNNVWVADASNNRVEEFNSSGTWIQSIPSGCADSSLPGCPASSANGMFSNSSSIAIDSSNNVWVADSNNNRIEEFNSSGTFIRSIGDPNPHTCETSPAGSPPACVSGAGNGQFYLGGGGGMAFDSSGNLWVSDTGNERVQEFNSTGTYIKKFGSYGSANGKLDYQGYLAVDPSGNIWIGDGGNNRVEEFSSSGSFMQSIGGPSPYTCETSPAGSVPACAAGTGSGQFNNPSQLAIGSR